MAVYAYNVVSWILCGIALVLWTAVIFYACVKKAKAPVIVVICALMSLFEIF